MARSRQIAGAALAEALPDTRKHWFQQPHLLKLNLILLIPMLSSTVVGYDGTLMSSLQSFPQWQDYFSNPTSTLLGTIIAAQPIGGLIALPFTSDLCDRLGRKRVLLCGVIITCSGAAIQGASVNVGMFIFARIIIGFGGMFGSQPSPMLIAELAYPSHRGKCTSAYWTFFYLGSILASWFTFGSQNIASSWSWRIPSILQAACPVIQLLFLWWMPESPRWLIAQDRIAEASATLKKYHDGHVDPNIPASELVTLELTEITNAIKLEKDAQHTGWTALLATPGNRKRTIVTICTGTFSIWDGITVVTFYIPLVLTSVGVTSAYWQTLINGLLQVFNFFAALLGAFLVDRVGRRPLFLWSTAGMLISYIIWTACAAVNSETGSQPAGIVVIVCVFVMLFHHDIAWSPLVLGYPTEIFPYSLRSKGLTVDMVAMYGSLVITAYCHPIGLEDLGWRYYIVFCVFLVCILGTVYFYFPETRGFTLEEIRVIFDGGDEEGERASRTAGTTRQIETAFTRD